MTIKAKDWKGDDLTGTWEVSVKIDGVQAICTNGDWLSRSGKWLWNLPPMPEGIYEVYLGSWERSVSACRTHSGSPIPADALYQLEPALDPRLYKATRDDLTAANVRITLRVVLSEGYEGIMLRQGEKRIKVKPRESHDVEVLEEIPGKGKHEGRIGALVTKMGKVGTGFTDAQREFENDYVGKIIEVECMGLTPKGKFRHPRFLRVREDK